MKSLLRVLAASLFISSAWADAAADAKAAAQAFYDGYMTALRSEKQGAAEKWVLNSDAVLPTFKKAYRVYMKEADADPITSAQDFPNAGFKVTAVAIKGSSATVTLTSRDASFKHSFKVTFAFADGKWRLAGTADVKPH